MIKVSSKIRDLTIGAQSFVDETLTIHLTEQDLIQQLEKQGMTIYGYSLKDIRKLIEEKERKIK